MSLTLKEVLHATGGQCLQERNSVFNSFGIDSRKMKAGGLFFALKGETTDGHLFVSGAAAQGAWGAVVEKEIPLEPSLTVIRVSDSLKALQDLAGFMRSASSATFVGITGSSGKTSTKEFTAGILTHKYDVYKSEGNLNSLTGLPLSLLSMRPAKCAVFEVAMNHPGEIEALSLLLKPDIGLLLNVNAVHLGQFPSIEAIANEKCSLQAGMNSDSILIFNADDPLITERIGKSHQRLFSFGFSENADLRIVDPQIRGVDGSSAILRWKNNEIDVRTSLCGRANLYNLAAASAVAVNLQLSPDQIADGIDDLRAYEHRGVLIHSGGDIHIYDDSYNSNPKALEMALQMVAASSKNYRRKIAVLGDMLELGSNETQFHAAAGEQVAANHFDALIASGPLSQAMVAAAAKAGVPFTLHTPDSEAAGAAVERFALPGDLILVKGSRGMKMENVIKRLKKTTLR